ncbi:F0F1 ATP synthase subunit A [Sulfurimonas autotrophica]|uniref:ATP synthase subunit a n=1 Tax=Sulfurimonas autotrophica (strain ATCC BAA-671 / DSM 16294 / JCM 11897 / OK10) TaxID=563040 RepID=E0UUA6_SULAO|nr:F0F1 ATP synthase subunit A [Sulfurimonas autotrophica]ADN09481.1 ATP synthase F0 subcomplex A subunit [Sulfurimonas autotrophica DSM 16294]
MGELFTFFGLISEDKTFIFMSHMLLSAGIALILARMAMSNLQLVPKGTQNLMEAYVQGVWSMGTDVMGKLHARKYVALVSTLGLFIGIANIIGIFPGFEAPTAMLEMPLALALTIFVYYNFVGIREHGLLHYLKHFLGPVWWLYWLMFPIEIVSHISRIISLSFRLFGNVKGDDMFLMVILMLAPWVLPIIPFALLTFMAFLQAFIFMMLTYVYLGGSLIVDETI